MSAAELRNKLSELEQSLITLHERRRALDLEIDLQRNSVEYIRRRLNNIDLNTEILSVEDAAVAIEAMSGRFISNTKQL